MTQRMTDRERSLAICEAIFADWDEYGKVASVWREQRRLKRLEDLAEQRRTGLYDGRTIEEVSNDYA